MLEKRDFFPFLIFQWNGGIQSSESFYKILGIQRKIEILYDLFFQEVLNSSMYWSMCSSSGEGEKVKEVYSRVI